MRVVREISGTRSEVRERTPQAPTRWQGDYSRRWRRVWGGTVAVSLAPAALVVRPAALLAAAVAGAVVAVVAFLVVSADRKEPFAARLARACRVSTWGAATTAAVVFVGTVSGSLMVWLVLLALLSSPSLVAAARGRTAGWPGSLDAESEQLELELTNRDVLARLTTAELCQAWRSTHVWLQTTTSPLELAAYARLRQLVLEELEQRNPRAVTRWLAEGGDAREAPAA